MSKKSRKRNKKILAVLGLAAAATAASRRKKAAIADTDDAGIGVSRTSNLGGTDHIPKVVVPKAKAIVDTSPVNNNRFRTRQRITDSAGNTIASAGVQPDKMPNTPPPSIGNPYRAPRGPGPRKFASGGRTGYSAGGAAKRGVSPILMKGKK
jgi:hypothetical protein